MNSISGDHISEIPYDMRDADKAEIEFANSVFECSDDRRHEDGSTVITKIVSERPSCSFFSISKESLIAGAIYLLLSTSLFDGIIQGFIPITSNILMAGIKTILFIIIFTLIRLLLC